MPANANATSSSNATEVELLQQHEREQILMVHEQQPLTPVYQRLLSYPDPHETEEEAAQVLVHVRNMTQPESMELGEGCSIQYSMENGIFFRLIWKPPPMTKLMGMIGIEAGWTATEVGRQPWVIQGVMRTADAVTPMPGLVVPFLAFSLLYLFLGLVTLALLRRQFDHSPSLPVKEVSDAA